MTDASSLLFVLNTLAVGGSESKTVRIANALVKSGTSAEIAYLNPPETLRTRIDSSVSTTHLERRGKYSFHTLRRLRQLIDGRRCVVVAVNLYPLLYAVPATKFPRQRQGRVVCLVNTATLPGHKRLLGEVYAPFLRRCDRIIFGCAAQQRLWTDTLRLPPERVGFIYNGVDPEYFTPLAAASASRLFRREHEIPDDAVVYGSVGRMAPEKCFDLLIRALARLNTQRRNSFLVLVGQGDERAKLERLAVRQGVGDRVRFLGLLADVRPAISMMDVFVLPSSETFSNAALEAMSMARPVVLSNIGGATEMLDHGESGLIFGAGDLDTLVHLLGSLHDSSELRERLGSAARQRVLDRLRFADMVEHYRTLLAH